MHAAYEELKEAASSVDGAGQKFVEIHGVCDTVDRADASLFINPHQMSGMFLTALYN